MKVTHDQIEAAKTPRGAWTRAQLAEWGVPWPPPRGWRAALERGRPIPTRKATGEGQIVTERASRGRVAA